MERKSNKLALVLGGGAAKGYAHIGVIKVLESIGLKPGLIVGCSMGSIVGGFYAYGFTAKEMESVALRMDLKRTLSLLAPIPSITGMIEGRRVVNFLKELLGGDPLIETLPTRYAAVAVDIVNHSEVVITNGSLVHAIRASIAIPSVFSPLDFGNALLVDGGVLDPVPVKAAKLLGADFVVAVNVLPRFRTAMTTADITSLHYAKSKEFEQAKKQFFRIIEEVKTHLKRSLQINAVIVGITSLGMMESEIINQRLAEDPPDVLIDVNVPIKAHEFHRAEEAIKSGEEAAKAEMAELLQLKERISELA